MCENKPIHVRKNVEDALRRLRFTDKERLIWIDALCINQSDEAERNSQVATMRDIYAGSQQTVIWLSSHLNTSSSVIDFVRSLTEHDGLPRGAKDGSNVLLDPPIDAYEELGILLDNAWFHRVWIIQEVVVSPQVIVQYGDDYLLWDVLVAGCRVAMKYLPTYQIMFNPRNVLRLNDSRQQYRITGPFSDLLSVLRFTRYHLSTLEADKLYGILGLTDEQLDVDYSLTSRALYQKFALTALAARDDLQILNLLDDDYFRLDRALPSWVPSLENHYGPIPFADGHTYEKWNASFGTCAGSSNTTGQLLLVEGFKIDKIRHVGMAFLERTPLSGAIRSWAGESTNTFYPSSGRVTYRMLSQWARERVQNWHALVERHGSMFDEGNARNEAHLRTILAGNLHLNMPETMLSEHDALERAKQGFDLFCRLWITLTNGDAEACFELYKSFSTAELDLAMAFVRAHIDAAWGRCLFTNKAHGMVGLVPRSTRFGDLVVILHGGKTPYILRPKTNGRFKLVGECYVDGYMHGEAELTTMAQNVQKFKIIQQSHV